MQKTSIPWPDDIYRYLSFDQIAKFQKSAEDGARIAAVEIQELRA